MVIFLFGFLFGIILFENPYTLIIPSIICILLFIILRKKIVLLVFVLALFLGFFRSEEYFRKNFENVDNNYNCEIDVEAEIISEIEKSFSGIVMTIKTENFGKILVRGEFSYLYKFGDLVKIRGLLQEPPQIEDFDYKEYLRTQNINYVMIDPDIKIIRRASFSDRPLIFFVREIRDYILKKFDLLFAQRESSLAKGLIIGTKESFSDDYETSLRVSGTSHIISVSGYNIALVVSIFMKLSGWIDRKRLLKVIIIFLVLYLFVVGIMNIPALRATIMGIISILGLITGRKINFYSTMSIVCSLMLWWNPLIFKSISFLLSVFATFGIVKFLTIIEGKFFGFLPKAFRGDLEVTLCATLWTLPISIYSFQSFSLHSLVSNMFILPFVPMVTIGSILLLFISLFSGLLTKILSIPVNILLILINILIMKFGSFENLYLENFNINLATVFLLYLFFLLVLIRNELVSKTKSFSHIYKNVMNR